MRCWCSGACGHSCMSPRTGCLQNYSRWNQARGISWSTSSVLPAHLGPLRPWAEEGPTCPTRVKTLLKALHRLKHDAINSPLHSVIFPYKFLFLHGLFKSRNTFNFTLIMGTDLSLNPLKVRILWIKYNSISIKSNFSHKPLSNKSWRTIIKRQTPARINVTCVI